MRTSSRHRRRLSFAVLLITMIGMAATVQADGIDLDRYSASETLYDGFHLSRPDDMGDGRFGFNLHLDYANDPLVLELTQGASDTETARVVSDHLTAHLNLALGLWDRVVFFGGVNFVVLMEGESFRDPFSGQTRDLSDGTGLGDARLGGRLRIAGENADAFGLSLQLTGALPVGDAASGDQNFSGEEGPTFTPELLIEARPGGVRFTGNVGARVRQNVDLGTAAVEDEFLFGLGLTIPVVEEELDLLAEFYGTSSFDDFGGRESSPTEVLLGGKYWFEEHVAAGVAGAMGLTRGVGSPDFRIVASFGWVTPLDAEQPKPKPKPKPKPGDRDGDGYLDPDDTCPDDPEDFDGFEDAEGCPDPDNDQDQVLDVDDKCPMDPEDRDDFEDLNGCPDPDNDEDGVLDPVDQCPLVPEDRDTFEDLDGCADPDNDQDQVLDVDDKCPMVPGDPSEQGCSRVKVEEGRILILDRVEFATSKDVILERSTPILNDVMRTLEANPRLRLVRIEGHTDDRGRDKSNMDLSRRRAASVRRWLTERGVEAHRFEAWGCGETNAVETNDTSEGRQANRRVEFHILDPAPAGGARSIADCQKAR